MSERKKDFIAGAALLAMWAPIVLLYAGMFDKWVF